VPFLFPFHGAPSDFFRFSDRGLAQLCSGFRVLRAEALGNYLTTCSLFLQRPVVWSPRTVEGRRQKAALRLRLLTVGTRMVGILCYLGSRLFREPDDYTCLYCLLLEKE
jgi:hypothetical protein